MLNIHKSHHQVYPQLPHLKVLLIFLLKIPNAHIDAPRSTPPILRMFVEPQVGHFGNNKENIIKGAIRYSSRKRMLSLAQRM